MPPNTWAPGPGCPISRRSRLPEPQVVLLARTLLVPFARSHAVPLARSRVVPDGRTQRSRLGEPRPVLIARPATLGTSAQLGLAQRRHRPALDAVNTDLELRPDVANRRKVKGNVVAWITDRVDEWLAGLHEAKSR